MSSTQASDAGDENFQGLLLQARGRKGLTQRELADQVGVLRVLFRRGKAASATPGLESLKNLIVTYLRLGVVLCGDSAGLSGLGGLPACVASMSEPSS